ncbi:MAG: cobalamin B12-binding domain-containing protein [Thermoleophilaceae bacterium]|nr:cobalamin B12-binding domain-containing protein [Thermoleophilaceae bacterium]
MDEAAGLRIGELSYRVGVSPDVLRAWEKRYRLLRPTRSKGGYRLYTERDEWRVRLMQQQLWSGLSAAQAAQQVARIERESNLHDESIETPFELSRQLAGSLEAFDEDRAHELLDRLFGLHGLEKAIRDAIMPYLRELGERWAQRQVTIAQEHFASRLIEGRLLALARGWNKGRGPRAVLACPPGEQHTLPLVSFGLILRSRGWRNIYLGGETPPSTVQMAADTVAADVVVMSAVSADRFAPIARELRALARRCSLLLAGPGATPEVAAELDVQCLSDDPATAAEALSRRFVIEKMPHGR